MTLKRPRDKGTQFETKVANTGFDYGYDEDHCFRMPASSPYDIKVVGSTGRVINALAAKADYGQALVTIPLNDFFHLLSNHGDSAHIECKRLAKIALHSIYEDKFPR